MRLFVAIFLPETLLAHLEALSRRFDCPRLKWTPPEAVHLTVRFLGETGADRMVPVASALLRAASAVGAFDLAVTGGGVFPDAGRPRIFWAGLQGDVPRLLDLAERTSAELALAGLPAEGRAFAPHLTLARCRADARCLAEDARRFVEAARSLPADPFCVDRLHLVRSHLGSTGARYETIETFPLAA